LTSSVSVDVVDSKEPDGSADSARSVTPDALNVSYLNSPGDSDWRFINVDQGDELALTLSNLPADYDLALFTVSPPALQSATAQPVPSVSDVSPAAGTTSQPSAGSNEIDLTPPPGYQLFAVSANRGTGDETIQTPPLDAGSYVVHITGYNG